jgi:hypothetical protein
VIVSDSVTLGTATLQRMPFGAANLIKTNFNDDVRPPPYGVAKCAINVSDLRHEKQILDPF